MSGDLKKVEPFSWKRRALSFGYAFRGLAVLLKYEHNARIHTVAAISITIAGIYFRIDYTQWLILAFSAGLVFIAEILNTAIEYLCDMIHPEYDRTIGRVKDLTAAAVLIASILAVFAGIYVFGPLIF